MTHKPTNEAPQVASLEASESCASTAPAIAEAPIPNENQDVYSKLELKATAAQKTVLPKTERKPGREITLSEGLVQALESRGRDLQKEIELTREENGYRIKALRSDSPFAKAGLQKGELITNKALEQLKSNSDSGDLPQRFSLILDSIVRSE